MSDIFPRKYGRISGTTVETGKQTPTRVQYRILTVECCLRLL